MGAWGADGLTPLTAPRVDACVDGVEERMSSNAAPRLSRVVGLGSGGVRVSGSVRCRADGQSSPGGRAPESLGVDAGVNWVMGIDHLPLGTYPWQSAFRKRGTVTGPFAAKYLDRDLAYDR